MILKILKIFSAILRVRKKDVCEMSTRKIDFHDYPDTKEKLPWHLCVLKCERCGKMFVM